METTTKSVKADFFYFCGYNGNKKELAKASPAKKFCCI